jgi:hypothetical protein
VRPDDLDAIRASLRSRAADAGRAAVAVADHRAGMVDAEKALEGLARAVWRAKARPLRDGDPGSEAPARDETAASLRMYGVIDRKGAPREDSGPAFERWAKMRRGEGLLRG